MVDTAGGKLRLLGSGSAWMTTTSAHGRRWPPSDQQQLVVTHAISAPPCTPLAISAFTLQDMTRS